MVNQVQELLTKNSIYFIPKGRDFLTKCFNPEHNDSNPSFRIDQTSGIGHCFSCGYKFNIFKYYGVLTNNVSIKLAKLKEKLKDVTQQLKGLEFPDGYTPLNMSFRGITAKTLRQFGAFTTDRVEQLEDRICFPIPDITGKTAVFVARHALSNGNPRYVNYPAGVTLPLYPSSIPKGMSSVVLVEGIFDMLNLYDKGLTNAVCCFGTNTLQGSTREKLLPFKAQGVTKVFLMFDGDEAGRSAAEKLKPLIEEENFTVEIISMEDNIDPGVLTKEQVEMTIEYIK